MIQSGQDGLVADALCILRIRKIVVAVDTVPVFLAALVHAGGGIVGAVPGNGVGTGGGIQVSVHIDGLLCLERFREIAQGETVIAVQSQNAVNRGIIAPPVGVAVIEVAAAVAVGFPKGPGIAVGFLAVIIADAAVEPGLALLLKGNGKAEHDVSVQIQGAVVITGFRIGLIHHHAHIGAVRDPGEGVGLRIPIFGDVHRRHGIHLRKAAHMGMGGGIEPAVPFDHIEEGGSVLTFQILFGEQAVGISLRGHGDRHLCLHGMQGFGMIVGCACSGGQEAQQHGDAQKHRQDSFCFHISALLSFWIRSQDVTGIQFNLTFSRTSMNLGFSMAGLRRSHWVLTLIWPGRPWATPRSSVSSM